MAYLFSYLLLLHRCIVLLYPVGGGHVGRLSHGPLASEPDEKVTTAAFARLYPYLQRCPLSTASMGVRDLPLCPSLGHGAFPLWKMVVTNAVRCLSVFLLWAGDKESQRF